MASNPTDLSAADDDEYQVQCEDEEDDERTIEEEEQLNSNDEDNELDDLQADADMPLDQLLKLYSQNGPARNSSSQEDDDDSSSDSSSNHDDCRPRFRQLLQPNGEVLPENDEDTDDSSFEPEIIKVINIGDDYQAQVDLKAEFDSTNENADDREVSIDELLWSPFSVSDVDDETIDGYLKSIRNEYPSSDEEISLQTLLICQWDTASALLQLRRLPVKTIYSYGEWSPDEIQQLEDGLREHGKHFYKISVSKCPNRTVRELVHYYYQWKKTDRYQMFIEEQQRMTAITSVTDMIEKFIEEQEQQLCTAAGAMNSPNTSTFLSNDRKRQSPSSSISFVTIHHPETMKRALDQVDHDGEPSAKKSALNSSASTKIV